MTLKSILSTNRIEIGVNGTTDNSQFAINTVVEGSQVRNIEISQDAVRTRLVGITQVNSGTISDNALDTLYIHVSPVNISPNFGTIGIGTRNPSLGGLKLDVEGGVEATAFLTGDIKFHKDGKLLWRMFEEEDGIYVENAITGKTLRIPLGNDTEQLMHRLNAQEAALKELREELRRIQRED